MNKGLRKVRSLNSIRSTLPFYCRQALHAAEIHFKESDIKS